MKTTKRILSLVLCFVMLVGLMPAITLNADAATGEVIDAAIFCSDVHGSSSSVSSAFSGIKNADSTFAPSTATFVGDTQMAASSVTSAAQGVYSDVACYYAYGNHDSEGNYGISDVTGLLYSGDNYYIYAISQTSMASSNPDTSGFTSTVAGLDKTKPLFIASHLPLHDRRGDSNGAAAWYEAISAAADQMDIVFFWAHNHTGENDVDRAAFYVAKDGDETFTLENTSTVVTPNFTYMNAGFVGKSSSRGGVVTTVKIYSDALVFQDYTSSGAFTGEYSHNVEVAREFASSTDSGDGGSTGTTDPTEGTTAPTEGEDDTDSSVSNGVHVEGTDTTTNAYVYTATATADGTTGYILVSNGYALYNNGGSISATAVTVTDNVVTINDSSVDVADLLWTIDSDGDVMNDGYYLLRESGSSATAMSIDTTDSGTKYSDWTYADDTLTVVGGSNSDTTYYAYYDTSNSAFYTDPDSSQELKFYGLSEVTTNTSGTYYLDAKDVTTHSALSDTTSVTLTDVITFVADGSTTSTTVTDLDGTYAYAINDNTSGVIASVSDTGVVTINPNVTGTATVDVTYTWEVDGTTYSMTDTATIKVTEVVDQGVVDNYTSTTTGSEPKTVYVLVDAITEADNYLIVDSNSATTSANLLTAASSGVTNTSGVTVVQGTDADGNTIYYIENPAAAAIWTASSSSGGTLYNSSTSRYLRVKTSGGTSLTTTGESNQASTFVSSSNTLYRSKDSTKYYIRYNSGWTYSTSSQTVYVYKEETIQVDSTVTTTDTVSLEAGDPITTVVNGETELTLDPTILFAGKDATSTFEALGGTYTVEYVSGDEIISSTDGKTVTLNGTLGTATVRVKYTWTVNGTEYAIWDTVTITTKDPYYTLDLHKANITYVEATDLTGFVEGTIYYTQNEDGTYTQVAEDAEFDSSVTYYTLSYTLGEEITAPIAIKGIEEGDRYGVWAVVKYYDGTTEGGTDMGTVGSDIEWTSSDETIATVDKNTGIITFTGKEGTVTITATYLNGNCPSDSVVISVTQSQYTVPNDGTTDFPEYPNEGAIRYDKTATAVGNFSETGIAQVELSMTGVPYSTGSEIDVVIMLDMTGSMTTASMAAAEASALAFAKQIILNEDDTYNNNRISVQKFDKDGATELWALSAVTASTYNSLVSAIESASEDNSSGGTPYSTALQECYEILYAAKSDGIGNNRSQYCVFVSDGTPTDVTYITNTTTPTTTTTVSFTRNNATYTQTVPAYSTGSTSSTFESSSNSYHEYWSQLMINNGVSVYGVYTSAAAGSSGSGGGSVNDTTTGTICMEKVASSDDKVYVVEDYTDTSALTGVFTNIAKDILQAATDVIVEDQITDYYTMIFDIPTGSQTISGVTNDFYIEFLKYTLDSTTHERVDSDSDGDTYDDATSVTKLYLKNTDGVLSAASDSSGTAYAAPVFEAKIIGDKGTLMFWTTDSSYASKAAVSYNDGTNTYYFIPYGQEINEDGTIPTGWYNMTSGAYAYGTVDSTTNMSENLVIATPYFVYNASTKMIYWTLDKMQDATTEYALRYFLYLDNSATEVGKEKEVDPGSYLTNDHAYITYTNFKGNDCRQEFPKPQLTWSGAQVSYVFYLVNAAGQPINKSGQVVDFANATFVTDVYTENTVWNKGADGQITADSQLGIEWLAAELLPTDYKVYDEAAYYKLHVYGNHDGTSNFDYFIIDGNEADVISSSLNERLGLYTTESTVSLTTTKVYNTKAGTKITGYGTYASEEAADVDKVLTNFDFYNTTVAFAVVWQPSLAPDTVVVDYGLDVLINVCQNDLMQDNTISGIGLGRDAYGSTAENNGVSTTSKLGTADLTTADGSTISIENDQQIRFSQNDMLFNEPVTFYYESKTEYYEASEKQTGYLHTSVTVIPATTIYYEDEYVELTTYTKQADGTYLESKGWTVNSQDATATQAQDRPGTTLITGVLDANNNYGYDAAYSSMSEYSMGTAAKIIVNSDVEGWADFEFYGTGFDVIATSSNTTGAIVVEVYKVNSNGSYDIDSPVKSLTVDTYYGFKYENGEWVTTTENDPNALYQVPVMKIQDLPYAEEDGTPIKYHASILAFYGELFDHTGADQFEFCLDAIRIYDPTGNKNATANEAYKADGEGWPTYEEVRNYVIDAKTFESVATDAVNGIVFIDGIGNTATVSDYNSYGPNNELYLAPNKAITFTLTPGTNVAKIQMALKTVADSAEVEIYTVVDGAKGKVLLDQTISTATDMYYTLWEAVKNTDGTYTQASDMTLVIMNSGEEGVLSITNVKVTYTEAQSEETEPAVAMFMLRRSSVDDALATMNVEEEVPETTVPEETEPETTVPEETEPETTVPETTVPEETEPETTVPEETEPETTVPEETEPSAEEQVQEVVEKVSEIIKKIFGWLFG